MPLLRLLQARPLDANDLTRGIFVTVTPSALNAPGSLHGGAMAVLLDTTAYLGVLSELDPHEDAMTQTFFGSYLAPATAGDELFATSQLLRRARHIAFVAAELRSAERLVATATVVKSIRRR